MFFFTNLILTFFGFLPGFLHAIVLLIQSNSFRMNDGSEDESIIKPKPKKIKRVRKKIEKEKIVIVENPKLSNVWAIVLFLSVIIGSFQLSITGIVNIIKNGKDESLLENIKENKGSSNNDDAMFYNTDLFSNEVTTETDTVVSFISSQPMETSYILFDNENEFDVESPTSSTLENSKTVTEITSTSTVLDVSSRLISKNSISFIKDNEYMEKNNTVQFFDEDKEIFNDVNSNKNINNNNKIKRADDNNEEEKEEINDLILTILQYSICYIVSLGLTFAYYRLLLNYTDKVFVYTFYTTFVVLIAFCILLIAIGYIKSIILWTLGFFLIFIITVVAYNLRKEWRSKLSFSEIFLNESLSAIRDYPSIFVLGMINSIFAAILDFFIIYAMYAAFINNQEFYIFDKVNRICFIFFLMFAYFYSTEIVKSIIYVTSSTLYTYYLFNSTSENGKRKIVGINNPTLKCTKRTLFSLLGSICAISLVTTVFGSMQKLLEIWKKILSIISFKGEAAKSESTFIKGLGYLYLVNKKMIDFIEYISDLFGSNTLIELAIYGKPLIKSSEDSFLIMKEYDDDLMFNELIIKSVLILGEIGIIGISVIISALLCAIFGKFKWEDMNYGSSLEELNEYISIVSTGTKAIFSGVFIITDAAVLTLFTSICRDGKSVKTVKPDLYHKLMKSKPKNLPKKTASYYEKFLNYLNDFN